jgi:hypothetical protein
MELKRSVKFISKFDIYTHHLFTIESSSSAPLINVKSYCSYRSVTLSLNSKLKIESDLKIVAVFSVVVRSISHEL